LLNEAKNWIAGRLKEGVEQFDRDASIHDRTFYTTKLVLEHPEASKLMITAAMAGTDLDRRHPLHKLVTKMLKELKDSGKVRADMDLEILTYILFGSIASTIMLGQQNKGGDIDDLSERFTNEWNWILFEGIFNSPGKRKVSPLGAPRKRRTSPKN